MKWDRKKKASLTLKSVAGAQEVYVWCVVWRVCVCAVLCCGVALCGVFCGVVLCRVVLLLVCSCVMDCRLCVVGHVSVVWCTRKTRSHVSGDSCPLRF